MKTFKIYFSDLNMETQADLLDFLNLDSESDGNFEIEPLTILEFEDECPEDCETIMGYDCTPEIRERCKSLLRKRDELR